MQGATRSSRRASALALAVVAAAVLGTAGGAIADTLPTVDDCREGAAPVTLGNHIGSAAGCVAAGGEVVAYAGGNALIPCGSIVIAGSAAAEEDPNVCDSLLDLPVPDRLEYGVVLPSDYDTSGRSYPVLYLLTASVQDEWPTVDPNLQGVADLGVIIVLPARGFGFYTDWANGQHRFETLYTRELIEHVDSHYRTKAERSQRAVAGVSKAGYGAMVFAARHPDLYAAAASFSGIVDIARPGFPAIFTAQMSSGFARYDRPSDPLDHPIWGNPLTDEIGWHAKNPTDLAANLRGISLFATSGDGTPTPEELQNDGPTIAFGAHIEVEVRLQNENFHAALDRARIAHTYVDRSGTHNYRFWVRELHEWAPAMMSVFADPAAPPAAFDYRSADSEFSVWGWTFRGDSARAREFLDVENASRSGLALTGSGTTVVETPALFKSGQKVTVADDAGGSRMVKADAAGRLRISVDLGPPHDVQQYTAAGRLLEAQPGYFTTRKITFTPRTTGPPPGKGRRR